jgi:hypothetical protein
MTAEPPVGQQAEGEPAARQRSPGRPEPAWPRVPASDSDRDRLLGLLREHYARGNIDDAELDRRTETVLTARFTDQAAAAVAGLPLLTGHGPVRRQGRRHAQSAEAGPGWVPTAERFRDPTSRAIMRVWIDPVDDSRHYVPEPDAT